MHPEPTPVDLDALDALHAAAAPGGWWNAGTNGPPAGPFTAWILDSERAGTVADGVFRKADADCIAALHNAYPALRAELDACRAERDRLALALDQARGVLQEVEWDASATDSIGDPCPKCPACDSRQSRGHRPDCPLARALSGPPTGTSPGP